MLKYSKIFVLTKRSVCCFIHLNKDKSQVTEINTYGLLILDILDIIYSYNYVIIIGNLKNIKNYVIW